MVKNLPADWKDAKAGPQTFWKSDLTAMGAAPRSPRIGNGRPQSFAGGSLRCEARKLP